MNDTEEMREQAAMVANLPYEESEYIEPGLSEPKRDIPKPVVEKGRLMVIRGRLLLDGSGNGETVLPGPRQGYIWNIIHASAAGMTGATNRVELWEESTADPSNFIAGNAAASGIPVVVSASGKVWIPAGVRIVFRAVQSGAGLSIGFRIQVWEYRDN